MPANINIETDSGEGGGLTIKFSAVFPHNLLIFGGLEELLATVLDEAKTIPTRVNRNATNAQQNTDDINTLMADA